MERIIQLKTQSWKFFGGKDFLKAIEWVYADTEG